MGAARTGIGDPMSESATRFQKVIAKCWADAAYKQRLKADPLSVLSDEGLLVPEGVRVFVHENTSKFWTIVIPHPSQQNLSASELKGIASGDAGSAGAVAGQEMHGSHEEWHISE